MKRLKLLLLKVTSLIILSILVIGIQSQRCNAVGTWTNWGYSETGAPITFNNSEQTTGFIMKKTTYGIAMVIRSGGSIPENYGVVTRIYKNTSLSESGAVNATTASGGYVLITQMNTTVPISNNAAPGNYCFLKMSTFQYGYTGTATGTWNPY